MSVLLLLNLMSVTCFADDAGNSHVARVADARLQIFNRQILTLRASVLGMVPEDRVQRARARIEQQLEKPGRHEVSLSHVPPGVLVQIDGSGSFYIAPEDIDPFQQETLDSVSRQAQQALQMAISEYEESRNLRSLLHAALYALLATLAYACLLWAVWKLRRIVMRRSLKFANAKLAELHDVGSALIQRERLHWLILKASQMLSWGLSLLLSYQWLGVMMSLFPFTRPWGEHLNAYLFGLVLTLVGAILKAIPDLFVAVLIFGLAKMVTHGLGRFFDLVKERQIEVDWLDADLVGPTRRIVTIAVWLFALTMAYPYLPGSGTEAFKGVSVLVGLMISLGASSLVGQAASGLILTYSRVYRKGEFIRVAEHEGTITDLGMFTTRIRNGMGVELTLPNSYVLNNVTKNYSRVVSGDGFVIDTKVTIGYDTPWRQVEAMLIEAASRTQGVQTHPAPKVFQTALSDFYPEYLLICHAIPTEPRPRAEVINLLHANIQDVFNSYGVQIMSPHYLGDPAREKVVSKQDWYKTPAKSE
ncbi:mechanosensitive ion channel family protein [Undibacterium rugosum]|uniref:mechanosensitive ion channel family protein n=1 Tax=Undibacterium rugosum TaxID=2762291 RepID=UPI001B8136D7|nr:mechanosensitive ion channel domain-containing protein [Undibacterium rugosum]MBR7779698.1 mechanosensitive ion channel [Undibacterium rugosum]